MSDVVPEPQVEEPATVDVVDDGVWEGLGRLLALAPAPPRWLRLQVGDIRIDMGWSGEGPGDVPGPTTAAAPAAGTPVATGTDGPDGHKVVASTVGVFYRAPEPGAQAFVELGDPVSPGQQLGIIEAMKTMIPVRSDQAGTVAAVLVEDGTGVEYAETLFVLS